MQTVRLEIDKFLTLILISAALSRVAGAQYSITDLADLASITGEIHPSDINNLGQITGIIDVGSTSQAFVQNGSSISYLSDIPGRNGFMMAGWINNSSQVVGSVDISSTNPSVIRALIWQNGAASDIGALDVNANVQPRGINDYGQIIGASNLTPFIWQNGVMTNFNTLPGAEPINAVFAINNKGAVAGTITNPLYQHAVVWSAGTLTDLGDLPGGTGMFNGIGDWSMPQAINDLGQVVGASDSAAGIHPFFWDNGKMIDMGALPGNWRGGVADDINNNGVAVGSFSGNNSSLPFIWDQTNGLRDLNDLIANDPDGWILQTATAINDLGQIVGEGTHNGDLRGFLLTPLPEPPTALLAIASAAVFCTFRQRMPRKCL